MIADKDLLSMQYARILAENAREAQKKLAGFPQEKLDQIVEHVAGEMEKHARELAVMSFEETDYGRWQDKLIKISFVCRSVLRGLRGMRCVGTLREDAGGNVLEVGVPLGVIVALCPSTSPVSTAIYKALLAIKSGNAIIFSLHKVAMKPVAFLSVSTGISKASQNFTKSAAFLAPLAEMLPSNVSVFLPSASYTSLLFATAPTVAPFKRMKPVTMSFA